MSMRTMKKAEKAYFDQEYSTKETIKRLAVYASEQRKVLLILFMLLLGTSAVAIAIPLIIRNGINELERTGSDPDYDFVKQIGWLYFIGTIIEWMILFVMFRVQWIVIARSISAVRLEMFEKLQDLDVGFYDKMATGKIMSRVMDDSNRMGNLINIFASFFSSLTLIFVMIAIMFNINTTLTLWILLIIPFIITIIFFMAKYLRKFAQEVRRTRAAVNAAVQESVTGISVAKGFNREEKNREEFIEINQDNIKAGLRLSYTFSLFFPILDFLTVLVMFIIIYPGGQTVINGDLSVGDLFLFYSFTIRLFGPIIQLSQQVAQIQAGSAATERIFSLLDYESAMITGDLKPGKLKGDIEFNNVSFHYTQEEPVYKGLSVKIEAGQTVALVGHTGAGKTTMVSLLARFYEITGGNILLDGINVHQMDIEAYRHNLGIVLQDPYLFSGTIRENILYGNKDATDEDIEHAVKLTHLNKFIETLPEGLDTDVRERGSRLSTGQRQLVTFARALVANPSILILDEATASVDAYTESLIQRSLKNLFKGRTNIVVAHRLSTVINADRILVFDQGKIVGDGNHQNLLENNKIYRDLYTTYYEFQGLKPEIQSS
ncbi:MAG: putative ABC transporter ATP-binding protein [Candidatus Heimdallarchaeota archaeon LC_2]|nr:MAG: putative ABC transporter ATP-binding protein [Candidatus Heimdallarchaeota archaeon LC_2]